MEEASKFSSIQLQINIQMQLCINLVQKTILSPLIYQMHLCSLSTYKLKLNIGGDAASSSTAAPASSRRCRLIFPCFSG
jgi:hypothetical protein